MRYSGIYATVLICVCYIIFFLGLYLRGAERSYIKEGACYTIPSEGIGKGKILKITDSYVGVMYCKTECNTFKIPLLVAKRQVSKIRIIPCRDGVKGGYTNNMNICDLDTSHKLCSRN